MTSVDVKTATGASAGKVELPADIFDVQVNIPLIHQVVTAQLAAARQGTHQAKRRGEVSGSGKKPFKQKGTGRARAGMTSSPLWRGGGKIFPNTPDENFSQKVNRKMYRAGMASILSQLAREDRIRVVEEFKVDQPKTKLLAQKVKAMGLEEVLVITDEVDSNLALSSRNGYLSDEQRALAPALYRHLSEMARAIEAGERDYPALVRQHLARGPERTRQEQLGAEGGRTHSFTRSARRAERRTLPSSPRNAKSTYSNVRGIL